jgi:hypothetical protein
VNMAIDSSSVQKRLESNISVHTICAGHVRSSVARMAAIWNRSSSYLGIAPYKLRSDILVQSKTSLLP